MTSDIPPTTPPTAVSPPASRPSSGPRVALVVAVIVAAVAATVLAFILLGRDSDGVGAASPSPTGLATPESSPSPTADPTPTATPEPTPQTEPSDGLTHLDYGARATVVTDRLRIRYVPSTDGDAAGVVTAGQEMLILSGPITSDGFEWYFVELANRAESDIAQAWVAAVPSPSDNQPHDAWLIEIEPLKCPPDAVGTPMLARLTEYAIIECDVQVSTVEGLLDTCYEGPLTPYTYEPAWAWFSCYYLRDEEATWALPVYFPPEMADQAPERGDIVTLTGSLGIDTDKYGPCTVTTTEPGFPAKALAREQLIFAASCPTKFVVSGVTIDGHIDLPSLL